MNFVRQLGFGVIIAWGLFLTLLALPIVWAAHHWPFLLFAVAVCFVIYFVARLSEKRRASRH